MHSLKTKISTHQNKLKNLSTRIFTGKSLILSQSTPYEVIETFDLTQIRYYAPEVRKYKEPLVFVVPLAINMSIYDLYPYRSLVKYFQQQGFAVYVIDWGKLNIHNRHFNFLTFIDHYIPLCIQSILKHSDSEQISLHGWSMAGIFVTLYTALHQPNFVKNLMVLGSPIDSYKSGRNGQFFAYLNRIISKSKAIQQQIYQGKIPKRLLHTTGRLNTFGFKIIDPIGWFQSHKNLLLNLDDHETLYEHATIGGFLNRMIDYPGGINQDMLFNVWLRNPLKTGLITLNEKSIALKNIRCSLLVAAGTTDQLVTAEAAQPLTQLTSSTDVTFTLIPGGHLGLMSSKRSADEFWPQLAQWLSERSSKI